MVCVRCFDETQQNLEAIKPMGVINRLTKLAFHSYNRALRILPSTVSGLNPFTMRPLATKEAYQVLAGKTVAFDDANVVRVALARRRSNSLVS